MTTDTQNAAPTAPDLSLNPKDLDMLRSIADGTYLDSPRIDFATVVRLTYAKMIDKDGDEPVFVTPAGWQRLKEAESILPQEDACKRKSAEDDDSLSAHEIPAITGDEECIRLLYRLAYLQQQRKNLDMRIASRIAQLFRDPVSVDTIEDNLAMVERVCQTHLQTDLATLNLPADRAPTLLREQAE